MTEEEVKVKLGMDAISLELGTRKVIDAQRAAARQIEKIWEEEEVKKLGFFQKTKEKAEGFFKDIGGFAREAMGFLGITAGLEGINAVLEKGAAIKRQSAAAGVSTDFLQRTQNAGRLTGLEPEKVAAGMEKLNEQIGEAVQGSEAAQKNFAKWGISINGKSNEEIFAEISDKMHDMTDPSERAAMAVDLMGKSGKEMVEMLERGSKALDEMGKHGPILSKSDLDAITQLHETLTTFVNYLEVGLGHVFGWIAKISQELEKAAIYMVNPNEYQGARREEEYEKSHAPEKAKEAARVTADSDQKHKREVEQTSKIAKEHMEAEKKHKKEIADAEKAAHKEQEEADKKKREASEAELKALRVQRLEEQVASNESKIAHINQVTPTIEDLAGRRYTNRINRLYGKGGRFDLGAGDGPFAAAAQGYELAQKQQMWDIIHGNAVFNEKGDLIGGAAFDDKSRANAFQNLLGAAGVSTPQMEMEKLNAKTDLMVLALQNIQKGLPVDLRGVDD